MGFCQRLDSAEIAADRLPDNALKERDLVVEVEIDRGLAQSGVPGDIVETRGGKALFDKQRQGRIEDFPRPIIWRASLFGFFFI